jgi:hypothetical protein
MKATGKGADLAKDFPYARRFSFEGRKRFTIFAFGWQEK